MPSTPLPLRASWHSAALPIAPSPSTIVSKRFIRVMGSREAKAGDGNPGADAARYASAFPAPPGCREHHARESAAQARSPGIPVLHDRSADAPAVRAAVDVAPRPADRALRQPDWRRAAQRGMAGSAGCDVAAVIAGSRPELQAGAGHGPRAAGPH